ncbi:MAG: hypothetical protein J0M08_07685 [Bacteroidetes bacterium]|nr:hypothetical protein [Bacteroidota bacterium]
MKDNKQSLWRYTKTLSPIARMQGFSLAPTGEHKGAINAGSNAAKEYGEKNKAKNNDE